MIAYRTAACADRARDPPEDIRWRLVDFLVATEDLHTCCFLDRPSAALEPGQARLAVERFGLTANNITYAAFGEAMSYWSFFPAEDGWGRIPVWGFALVVESLHDQLEPGVLVYGYLPPSSELVVAPAGVGRGGFFDGTPHRAQLPAAYNRYTRADADPLYDEDGEDEQVLLRPLFLTAFLLEDMLEEAELFGAETVILSSASSKTAGAVAYLLDRRGRAAVVGLTSPRSVDFTRSLGVYGEVLSYDELDELPSGRAVYVDIAGDAEVRAAVHGRYREELAHSAVVGATHHDRLAAGAGELPGPRPQLFFAPDRFSKFADGDGRGSLERSVADAWRPYVQWTRGWLEVMHGSGPRQLEHTYLDLLDGRVNPSTAHVLTLAG
jgi:hypothetical protein